MFIKNIVYYQRGERIIIKGQMEKRLYIILKGTVAIEISDRNNRISLDCLTKGEFFGEIAFFHNIPRTATAIALDDVKLCFIDNEAELKKFLSLNPSFAVKMTQVLAKRIAKTDDILMKECSESYSVHVH